MQVIAKVLLAGAMIVAISDSAGTQCTDRLPETLRPVVNDLFGILEGDPAFVAVEGCVFSGPKDDPESIIGIAYKKPWIVEQKYCAMSYESRRGRKSKGSAYILVATPETYHFIWPSEVSKQCHLSRVEDIPTHTIVGPGVPVSAAVLALENQHILFSKVLSSEYGRSFESWTSYRLSRISLLDDQNNGEFEGFFDSEGNDRGPSIHYRVNDSQLEVFGYGLFIY